MTIPPSAAKKSKVLIIGATGFIGQFITQAALDAGKTTYLLNRSIPKFPANEKDMKLKAFEDQGAIILHVFLIHLLLFLLYTNMSLYYAS